jgi:hypothetical protein
MKGISIGEEGYSENVPVERTSKSEQSGGI